MKATFLSPELNKLKIVIEPIELPESPLRGDFIGLMDFLNEDQKKIYDSFCKTEKKIDFATVVDRSWHIEDGEATLYLHVEHTDQEEQEQKKPFVF